MNHISRSAKVLCMLSILIVFMASCDKKEETIATYGAFDVQGKRPNMEDESLILVPFLKDQPQSALFAIFDGHGGKEVATYAKENFPDILRDNLSKPTDSIDKILIKSIETLNENLRKSDIEAQNKGSCAIIALKLANQLYIANVGDSRAILSIGGKAVSLSEDQTPTDPNEKQRIINAGGFVMYGRVNGILAVSRALGDFGLKPVIATPVISDIKITDSTDFLILTCDGIFESNIMSRQDAVNTVKASLEKNYTNPDKAKIAAQDLVYSALDRGSKDNLSALVVLFNYQ